MDYILGRNPLDQSYVTGYGARPLENPYHRFWCHQANDKYPSPPPGVLSGGPNSELQDPYVQAAGLIPCAPQKCFIDNGEAWSVNEVTINWNAPLAWVAAWLDEKAGAEGRRGAAQGADAREGEKVGLEVALSRPRGVGVRAGRAAAGPARARAATAARRAAAPPAAAGSAARGRPRRHPRRPRRP